MAKSLPLKLRKQLSLTRTAFKPPPFPVTHALNTRSLLTAPSVTTSSSIFDPIRDPSTLSTHILLASGARKPLITLWTASWCQTCKTVSPIIEDMVERFGEQALPSSGHGRPVKKPGGVMFAEVEIDSPTGGAEMAGNYAITSVPTLLSFVRQQPRSETKTGDVGLMKDPELLWQWLDNELIAERGEGNPVSGGPRKPRGIIKQFFHVGPP